MYGEARHVIAAYSIPGDVNHLCEDYCDDGEHNAGHVLLKWMKQQKMTAKVMFVVRFYGGKKLGPSRFQCIIDAAKKAVQVDPNSTLLPPANNQTIEQTDETEAEPEAEAETDKSSVQSFKTVQKRRRPAPIFDPTKPHQSQSRRRGAYNHRSYAGNGGRGGRNSSNYTKPYSSSKNNKREEYIRDKDTYASKVRS